MHIGRMFGRDKSKRLVYTNHRNGWNGGKETDFSNALMCAKYCARHLTYGTF